LILRKILIANRGEIAVRVMRACRDMGLATVAVYSECDRAARHVRMADEAIAIGPSPPVESYLRIDRIIDAAKASGADAIHPGYGFLSENEDFAATCRDAGLTFIGPTAEAITLMGSKTAARRAAMAAGVPVVPGTEEPLADDVPDALIVERARQIGFPVMVKAVAGGGGKGMRVVSSPADLPSAIRAARSEAGAAFGDSTIYLERRLERARHIEVQLLAEPRSQWYGLASVDLAGPQGAAVDAVALTPVENDSDVYQPVVRADLSAQVHGDESHWYRVGHSKPLLGILGGTYH